MWSYHETSAGSIGATSVSYSTASTSSSGTVTTPPFFTIMGDTSRTVSNSAEFVSGQTSTTYINTANTTQTLTTTFASLYSTTVGTTIEHQEFIDGAFSSRINTGTNSAFTHSDETFSIGGGTSYTYQYDSTGGSTWQRVIISVTRHSSVSGETLSFTRVTSQESATANSTTTNTTGDTADTFTGLTSTTGTSLWLSAFTYSSTTFSYTTTATANTTATTTRSGSFLSTSTSVSGTSTLSVTTTSSSADVFVTSSGSTAPFTLTSYQTGTLGLPCAVKTIVELNSNEWGWKLTGSGTDRVENIGTTFTRTTFSVGFSAVPVTAATISATGGASTLTFTVPSYSSRSTASTRSSTATSTYRVAQSGAAVPFTNTTRTATISSTRPSTFTLTFTSATTTRSSSLTHVSTTSGVTSTATQTDSVTTSFTGGTSILLVTYTVPKTVLVYIEINSAGAFQTVGQTLSIDGSSGGMSYSRDSTASAGPPSVAAVTIGEGWQASSLGRLQSIGTNLGSGTTNSLSEVATIWPQVRAPVAPRDAAVIIGAVPITVSNIKVSSRLGGYGWDSTAGSTATKTTGINRITTVNGSTSGTIEKTWAASASTYAMSEGVALAAENIPMANTTSAANGDSQFISFSAFPVT